MSNGILKPQFPKGNTVSMTVKQNKHFSDLLGFLHYFDYEYYMTDNINEYYLKCLLVYILVGTQKNQCVSEIPVRKLHYTLLVCVVKYTQRNHVLVKCDIKALPAHVWYLIHGKDIKVLNPSKLCSPEI